MTSPILEARDLAKVYRVYPHATDRLLEALTRRTRHREFVALSGVTMEIVAGESLGIIGENGAGKSTLLKMLAGIVAPSSGELHVRGKVASILELGSGFHPDLTGRQNIRLNAALLGLADHEIRRCEPEIVAFSELGEFIDEPVKCYSTGMVVRLGFAIATQVDPDILIIDEALSVGDGYFQKKCMDRLLALVGEGKTLLFCSHAMYYISAFCKRALWLRNGHVEALGPANEVVREYENFLMAKSARGGETLPPEVETGSTTAKPARLLSATLDGESALYRVGQPWVLDVEWRSEDPSLAFHLGVGINRVDEIEVTSFATHMDHLEPATGERFYRARLEIPALPLVKGEFTLYVFLLDELGLHVYDQKIVRSAFVVDSPTYAFGLVRVDHRWRWPSEVATTLPRMAALSGERSR